MKEKDTQSFNLNIEDCFKNDQFGRKLFEIASKDNLSEIENRILRAIHLLRLSIDEIDKGVSYVLISSAFEALLKQDLDVMLTGSIVFGISQNLAAILGKNYDECKDIISYFKELYSVRSSVTHKGDTKSKKNKEVDIKKAYEYLGDIIKKLCLYEPYRKYENLDKIHSEIVEKKLYTFNIEGF